MRWDCLEVFKGVTSGIKNRVNLTTHCKSKPFAKTIYHTEIDNFKFPLPHLSSQPNSWTQVILHCVYAVVLLSFVVFISIRIHILWNNTLHLSHGNKTVLSTWPMVWMFFLLYPNSSGGLKWMNGTWFLAFVFVGARWGNHVEPGSFRGTTIAKPPSIGEVGSIVSSTSIICSFDLATVQSTSTYPQTFLSSQHVVIFWQETATSLGSTLWTAGEHRRVWMLRMS